MSPLTLNNIMMIPGGTSDKKALFGKPVRNPLKKVTILLQALLMTL